MLTFHPCSERMGLLQARDSGDSQRSLHLEQHRSLKAKSRRKGLGQLHLAEGRGAGQAEGYRLQERIS